MSPSTNKLLFRFVTILVLIALPLWGNRAVAQCITSFPAPMTPWPTQVRFIPANPVPGEVIRMELGPLTLLNAAGGSLILQGQDIIVNLQVSSSGPSIPPPPHVVLTTIGSYPAGSYQVRLRLSMDSGNIQCQEIVTPLLVGPAPAPTPVPALSSPWWLATLIAGVLAVRLGVRRRRYG